MVVAYNAATFYNLDMRYVFVGLGVAIVIAFIVFLYIAALRTGAARAELEKVKRLKKRRLSTQERRGKQGEEWVKRKLNKAISLNDYLYSGLLVPYNKADDKTEIDLVLVSTKGIFCIEVKYLIGAIVGDEESNDWEQIYRDSDRPNRIIKNGYKQNQNHVSILKQKLNKRFDVQNIVIIANKDNDISNLNGIHIFRLDSFIESFNVLDDILDIGEVEEASEIIEKFVATSEELEAHKERLKTKYND